MIDYSNFIDNDNVLIYSMYKSMDLKHFVNTQKLSPHSDY